MRINNNVMALNSYRNLSSTQVLMGKSLEKLSSGFRINRAADDAAGLVISQGMRAQISGLRVATRNTQDGVSLVQTAEGALTEVHAMLQRMRDLGVQAANGSNDAAARAAANDEVVQLRSEIARIGDKTKFGSLSLFSDAQDFTFQVGAAAGDTIAFSLSALSQVVGLDNTASVGGISLVNVSDISTFISAVGGAISAVSTLRGKLGAIQNRFESTINSLAVTSENLTASESRIRDADMALEMVSFTRNQILTQAGTAMLGQANQVPQGVLRLLGG